VFVGAGLKARLVCLPSGHDPDSFVRQEGADGMRKLVDGAWSVTEFVVRTAPEGTDRESNIRSLIEVYSLIDDPIYRRLQVQEGAESLRFDENTIAYEANRTRKKALVGAENGRQAVVVVDRVERELIKLIVENESLLGAARDSLSEQYFKSAACREAFVLLTKMRNLKEADLARLVNAAPNGDVRNLLSSVMLEEEYGYDEPLDVFSDYVRKLRIRWLNDSIRSIEEEIRKKEASSDSKEMRALLSRLQELVVERSSLNGAREEALG
jgi:DNA primase